MENVTKNIKEKISITIEILNEGNNKIEEKKVFLPLKKLTPKVLREITPILNAVNEPMRRRTEEMEEISGSINLNDISFKDSMKMAKMTFEEKNITDVDNQYKNKIELICHIVDQNQFKNVPDVLIENINAVLNDVEEYKNDFWDNIAVEDINQAINSFREYSKQSL